MVQVLRKPAARHLVSTTFGQWRKRGLSLWHMPDGPGLLTKLSNNQWFIQLNRSDKYVCLSGIFVTRGCGFAARAFELMLHVWSTIGGFCKLRYMSYNHL